MSIVAYILNRSPAKRLEDITLEEAWTRAKPSVTHLRIYGLLRRKLDDKGTPHILIGYHSTRGYKLYELGNSQVSIRKDSRILLEEELSTTPTIIKDPIVRISSRISQLPLHLKDYELFQDSVGELVHFALITNVEPVEFEREELDLEIGGSSSNKKPIALKWVYKVKVNSKGEVVKHKARLVAKGFLHKVGIVYGEVYALAARIEIVKLVITIATIPN
ncbi:hypothetical protein CR513_05945, partial [Mucuna pruriens]